MKKIVLSFAVVLASFMVNAQIIPNVDFGLKAGVNLSKLNKQDGFNSDYRSGYLAGMWLRVGAMGLHLQPELYYAMKTADVKDEDGNSGNVDFTSIDLPILVGTKIGALGIGARLNTGPVVSFVVNEDQSFSDALNNASKFRYKDQALAWQFGAGVDIKKLSLDLRYEQGLSKISRDGYEDTKISLFNFSLGYKLF